MALRRYIAAPQVSINNKHSSDLQHQRAVLATIDGNSIVCATGD